MDNKQFFCVDLDVSKSPLTVHQLSSETPPIYPSVYWNEVGVKPEIDLEKDTAVNHYEKVSAMLNEMLWDDVKVSSFMAAVILENPAVFSVSAKEDWKANNIVICKSGKTITPLDLLTVTYNRQKTPTPHTDEPSSVSQQLSRFFAILLIYRKTLTRSTNAQYGGQVATRLNQFFQASSTAMKDVDTTAWAGYVTDDKLTPQYKRIVCAIDMLFFKHPNAPFAYIRMATLPSRYRGCAALTALGQIADLLGIPTHELVKFVLTKPVAKDIVQISKPDQHVEEIHGYFPYHLDMGISDKSPYSLTVNPTLCLWLHAIGAANSFPRSINARMPLNAIDVGGTFETGAAVGLALGSASDIQKRFVDSAEAAERLRVRIQKAKELEEQAARMTEDGAPEEDEYEPTVRGAMTTDDKVDAIMANLMKYDGLSPSQKETLRSRANRCRNCLPGTIGAYFYGLYGGGK